MTAFYVVSQTKPSTIPKRWVNGRRDLHNRFFGAFAWASIHAELQQILNFRFSSPTMIPHNELWPDRLKWNSSAWTHETIPIKCWKSSSICYTLVRRFCGGRFCGTWIVSSRQSATHKEAAAIADATTTLGRGTSSEDVHF